MNVRTDLMSEKCFVAGHERYAVRGGRTGAVSRK